MFFLACDIKTGEVLSELPLRPTGDLVTALGTVSSAEFELAISDPRCPEDWRGLIDPWRVYFICVSEEKSGVTGIVWAGIPQATVTTATSEIIKISCVSPEAYLSRRYVSSKTFKQVDQIDIAKWLVSHATENGLDFDFQTSASGVKRDREYFADDTATVLKRLEELAAVQNGFEWYIKVVFTDAAQTRVRPVFVTGFPRVGVASSRPQAVFELPGGLLEATVENRWGSSDAATLVKAKGSGEGQDTPFSEPMVDVQTEDAGIPRLEMVKTFSSVSTPAVLDAHAVSLLARFSGGTKVLSLKQRGGVYPLLGVDWNLGDDVKVLVDTDSMRVDGRFRVVGWAVSADLETITPYVADFAEDSGA